MCDLSLGALMCSLNVQTRCGPGQRFAQHFDQGPDRPQFGRLPSISALPEEWTRIPGKGHRLPFSADPDPLRASRLVTFSDPQSREVSATSPPVPYGHDDGITGTAEAQGLTSATDAR